jgi:hypothetical protein
VAIKIGKYNEKKVSKGLENYFEGLEIWIRNDCRKDLKMKFEGLKS